jgi:hypothetical protein
MSHLVMHQHQAQPLAEQLQLQLLQLAPLLPLAPPPPQPLLPQHLPLPFPA